MFSALGKLKDYIVGTEDEQKIAAVLQDLPEGSEERIRILSILDILKTHYESWAQILENAKLPTLEELSTKGLQTSKRIDIIERLRGQFLAAQVQYNILKDKISGTPFIQKDDEEKVNALKQIHIDKMNKDYVQFISPPLLALENRLKELESPKTPKSKKPAETVLPAVDNTTTQPLPNTNAGDSSPPSSMSTSTESLSGEEVKKEGKVTIPDVPELPHQVFDEKTELSTKLTKIKTDWNSRVTPFQTLEVNTLNDLNDVDQKIRTLHDYQIALAEVIGRINRREIERNQYHDFHQARKANVLEHLSNHLNNVVTPKLIELETYQPTLKARIEEAQRQQQLEAERQEAQRLERERQEEIRRQEEAFRREQAETRQLAEEKAQEEIRRKAEDKQRRIQEKAGAAKLKAEEAKLKAEADFKKPENVAKRIAEMVGGLDHLQRLDAGAFHDLIVIKHLISHLETQKAQIPQDKATLHRDATILDSVNDSIAEALSKVAKQIFGTKEKKPAQDKPDTNLIVGKATVYNIDNLIRKVNEYEAVLDEKIAQLKERLTKLESHVAPPSPDQPQAESIPHQPQIEVEIPPQAQPQVEEEEVEVSPPPADLIKDLPPEVIEAITLPQLPYVLQVEKLSVMPPPKQPSVMQTLRLASEFFMVPAARDQEEKIASTVYNRWINYFEDIRKISPKTLQNLPASEALAYYNDLINKSQAFTIARGTYLASHDGMYAQLSEYYKGIIPGRLKAVAEKAEMLKELIELGRQFSPEQLKRIHTPFTLTSFEEDKNNIFKSIFNDIGNVNNEFGQFQAKHQFFEKNAAEFGFGSEGAQLQILIKQRFDKYISLRDKIKASPKLRFDEDIHFYEEQFRLAFNAFQERMHEIDLNKWDAQTNSPSVIEQAVKKEVERVTPFVNSLNANFNDCIRLSDEAQTKFETRARIIEHSPPEDDHNEDNKGKFLEDRINFIDARIDEETTYLAQLMLIDEDIKSSNAKANLTENNIGMTMLSADLNIDNFDIDDIEFESDEVEIDQELYEAIEKAEASRTQTRQNKTEQEITEVIIKPESKEEITKREIKKAAHQVMDPMQEHLNEIKKRNALLAQQVREEIRLSQEKIDELGKQKKKDIKSLQACEQVYLINDKFPLVNGEIFTAIKKSVLANDHLTALKRHGQKRKGEQISLYLIKIKEAKNLGELLTAIESDPKINAKDAYSMRDRTGFGRFFGNPQKSTSNNLAKALEREVKEHIENVKNDVAKLTLEQQAKKQFEKHAKNSKESREERAVRKFTKI